MENASLCQTFWRRGKRLEYWVLAYAKSRLKIEDLWKSWLQLLSESRIQKIHSTNYKPRLPTAESLFFLSPTWSCLLAGKNRRKWVSEADFTLSYEGVNPIERAFIGSCVAEITWVVVSTKRTCERTPNARRTPGGTWCLVSSLQE